LDLFREQDLDVRPFAFSPLQLASLFSSRNLETLEAMGGVDAILRALGTHPTRGLSTELGPPGLVAQVREYTTDKDPPMLNTITSPGALSQGMQSMADLAGSTGVRLPTDFQFFEDSYRASIEDRQRTFDRNIVPQKANKTLLQLMWLALKDKVLVC
jgi:Ca2+-transporting ATPase